MTKELGEKYTDMEMELMHYHADQDKDGRITFEEFEALLRRIRK
jgi:Ca2+-binding EF-hand superfamily protein